MCVSEIMAVVPMFRVHLRIYEIKVFVCYFKGG